MAPHWLLGTQQSGCAKGLQVCRFQDGCSRSRLPGGEVARGHIACRFLARRAARFHQDACLPARRQTERIDLQ